MTRNLRLLLTIVALLLVVVAVGATLAPRSSSPSSSSPAANSGIASGDLVGLEATLARQLDSLVPHCRQSRADIAEILWSANQILIRDDYPEPLTTTADAVVAGMTATSSGMDCQFLASAYIVLREKG